MSQEVAYVRQNLEIVREILTSYGTIEKASSALTFRQQEIRAYYDKRNLRFPELGALLSVLMTLSDEKKRFNFQTAEEVATTHKVYVVPKTEGSRVAAHLRVDRVTETREVAPADRVAQMTAPFEKSKPGITKFVGDMVNLFDFSRPTMIPYGEASQFENSRVAPGYNYASLVMFASLHGHKLMVGKAASENVSQLHSALVQKLSQMSDVEYLELQSAFYVLACKLPAQSNSYLLRQEAPIRYVGHVQVEGKGYFEANPTFPREMRNGMLHRESQWKITLPEVLNTKQAIRQLTIDRGWRGEDKGRYSYLSRSHATGGDLPLERVEVCNALSLVLPWLRRGKHVHLKLKSVATIPLFQASLAGRELDNDQWGISYEATASQLQEYFKADYVKFLAPTGKEYLTVDMTSGRMPSFTKTEDIDEKWAGLFPAGLPKAPYIAVTKVPPSVADKYNVFYFNSAHAFDFVVSSMDQLIVASAPVEILPGEVRTGYQEEVRQRQSSADILNRQYADNRRKLSYYLEFEGPRYDPKMNLWIPDPKVIKSKKDLLVPELTMGANYLPVASFGDGAPAPAPPIAPQGQNQAVPVQGPAQDPAPAQIYVPMAIFG